MARRSPAWRLSSLESRSAGIGVGRPLARAFYQPIGPLRCGVWWEHCGNGAHSPALPRLCALPRRRCARSRANRGPRALASCTNSSYVNICPARPFGLSFSEIRKRIESVHYLQGTVRGGINRKEIPFRRTSIVCSVGILYKLIDVQGIFSHTVKSSNED